MTDYRLDRLSPRLFEHIVQELAIGTISTTVTPFGDGPDGGREAIFEGKTAYGADQALWNGYGIIQAKYKARLQSVASDGAWAISQLKAELKQFTRREKRREAPEYYIFATNVVLAPNEGGVKDKLRNILRKFANDKDLKGFDVWDYDKLRTLIGRDEKVRRSYLAWLSPSDVLAELCDYFESQKKDFYKVILRYLQNELLADQYAKLEQAGDSKDEAIPLSQVFIDLPTSNRLVSQEAPKSHVAVDETRFVSQIIRAAGEELRSKAEATLAEGVDHGATHRRGRYVLIGGPGQGKTTISQYICQIFRCELLQTVPAHMISPEAQVALRNFSDQCQADYRATARRLPFRVVLSEFAKNLAQGKIQSLMGFLALKLCAKGDISLTTNDVEKIIGEYPAIVILDGLDEVPPATNRDEIISAVSAFSIDVSTSNLDVLIVATSRPQGYNEEFSPRQYLHRYLVPLAPADAMEYGSRLANIRFGFNEERYDKVVSRLKRALSKPATMRLMRTPLQVTILTLLVDRMGDPPDERWSLFKDYYQLIYERETERDISSVAVLKTNPIEIDVIHRRVGIALQVESEKSGGTDARLTVDQFSKLVEDYLKEEGHEEPSLSNLKQQIIEAAANRLVFLVGLEAGWVGFEIRSLQEFMAAQGITDTEDKYIYDRLRAIAPAPHWRNVYLFAAGRCFSDRRYLRPAIEGICNELNDDPDDESLRSLMVGSELALDLLEDGPARKAPLTRGGMTRLALKLLGASFQGAARLAGVCEEETKYIYVEDLRARLTGPEAQRNLSWECLTYLVDRYGGDFEDLARDLMSQNQPSEAELSAMIEAATGSNPWLTAKLRELVGETTVTLWPGRLEIDNEDGQYGPWVLNDQPEWLRWYLQVCASPRRQLRHSVLRMSYDGESIMSYDLRLLSSAHDYDLMPPNETPEGGRWDELRLLGEFCINPSKDSLAAAIRGVSSRHQMLLDPASGNYRYPWPLAEAVSASQYSPDGAVLRAVEAGHYGDTDDWLANEKRYIEGSDILELASENPVVMTEDGGLFPFPFRSVSTYETRVMSTDINKTRALLDAYRGTDSILIKQYLSLILLNLPIRDVDFNAKFGDWLDDVLSTSVCQAAFITPTFWHLLDKLNLNDPAWGTAFDKVPVRLIGISYSQMSGATPANEAAIALKSAYELHPDRPGLLIPLANIFLDRTLNLQDYVPAVNTVDPNAPVIVKLAAIICKLVGGASIHSISDYIHNVYADDPDVANVIGRAVLRRGLSYRDERNELMALCQMCDEHDTGVESYMRTNLSRRPSGVTKYPEWDRLNFPRSLYWLLSL